jgi:hypothetical protein
VRESSIPDGLVELPDESVGDLEPEEPDDPDDPDELEEPDELDELEEPEEPEEPDEPEFRLSAYRPSYRLSFPLASVAFIRLSHEEEEGLSAIVQVIWPGELQSANDSL